MSWCILIAPSQGHRAMISMHARNHHRASKHHTQSVVKQYYATGSEVNQIQLNQSKSNPIEYIGIGIELTVSFLMHWTQFQNPKGAAWSWAHVPSLRCDGSHLGIGKNIPEQKESAACLVHIGAWEVFAACLYKPAAYPPEPGCETFWPMNPSIQ